MPTKKEFQDRVEEGIKTSDAQLAADAEAQQEMKAAMKGLRINHVQAKRFKGDALDMDLSRVLVLTGGNGSGKSRIPEACTVAMIGLVPWARYKTPKVVFDGFATNGVGPIELCVTLANEAGDDIPIRRTIKMVGGTVKQRLEYRGVSKLQEAQDAIDKDLSLCAEALDFSKFENLYPREQQLYLLGLVKIPDEYEKNSLLEQISQSLMNASQRIFKTCEMCMQYEAGTGTHAKGSAQAESSNEPPIGWGECGLEIGKQIKESAPGCANWEGDEGWEDQLNSLYSISAGMISDLYEAWNDSREVHVNIEALEERSRALKTKVQNEVSRLTKLMEGQFRVDVKTAQEGEKLIGAITGTLAQIKTQLDELREREKFLIAEIEKEKAKVDAHADWLKDHRDFEKDVEDSNARYNKLLQQQREEKFDERINEVKNKLKADEWHLQKKIELNDLEAKRPELDTDKKVAGNAVADIRAKIEIHEMAKRAFCEENVKCPLTPMGCPTTKTQRKTILDNAISHIAEVEKELEPARLTHAEAEADFDGVVSEIDTITEEIKSATDEDQTHESRIKDYQGRKKLLQETIDLMKSNLKIHNDRLADHLANDKRIDSSDEGDKLKAELMNVTDNIGLYESVHARKSEEATREADQETTNTLLREAKQQLVLSKELVKIVGPSGVLGDVLSASLAPMVDTINEFLPDGRSCFIKPKGKGIDIGMSIDGEERSLMSLSDGEKSFFAAATVLAFMVLQKSNLKLLVINRFEGIDAKKQVALLKKIVPAAEKYGIQFIGCSCWPTPAVEGVEIIDLGGIE